METRYCIEYINPQHPLRDDGSINVRYDRVLTLEQAEHDLTLILSFGAKILNLYMGNVVDGKTGEWNPMPIPIILDKDDWFTTDCLNTLEVDLKQKSFVKIDRKLLFEICDAILNHYGYSDVNDCPENDSECFGGKWDEGFRKKVENIRRNS